MQQSRLLLRRTMLFSFAFLFLTASFLTVRAAGEIDTGFRTAVQDSSLGYVSTIVPQPDGKVLIGGNFSIAGNSGRSSVARLNADGTIDSTFNPPDFYEYVNGVLSLKAAIIYAIANQADGKIIVGGDFYSVGGEPKFGIARLNQDGSLDNT